MGSKKHERKVKEYEKSARTIEEQQETCENNEIRRMLNEIEISKITMLNKLITKFSNLNIQKGFSDEYRQYKKTEIKLLDTDNKEKKEVVNIEKAASTRIQQSTYV